MARRRIWASTPLIFLFLAPAAAFTADFSFYPASAQSCLNQAAASSKCVGATAIDLNKCLCGNGGNFVLSAATCIGKNDQNDAQTVYNTMVSACSTSNTPLSVAPNEFYDAVAGKSTTTTATTTTATSSATSTSTNSHTPTSSTTQTSSPKSSGGSLSTGATIGIAVGASLVGVGAIGGLVLFLIRRKKRRGEESHPMLPQYGQEARFSPATTFPATEPSPGFSPFVSEAKPPAAWASPQNSPDPYGNTWDSTQGQYKGPYAPPEGVVELPPQTAATGPIFEMDGSTTVSQRPGGPIEMQGSLPHHNNFGHNQRL